MHGCLEQCSRVEVAEVLFHKARDWTALDARLGKTDRMRNCQLLMHCLWIHGAPPA